VSDLADRVGAWLDAHLGELAEEAPVAVHLDRVHDLTTADDLVGAALAAFAALAARIAHLGDPGVAGLVLPLRADAAGAPATPGALERELHPNELPSLYLAVWPGAVPADERRQPLPFALGLPDGALPANRMLDAYYVEHRSAWVAGDDQLLERAVRLDVYPTGSRLRRRESR
jgi:hypothetical protein